MAILPKLIDINDSSNIVFFFQRKENSFRLPKCARGENRISVSNAKPTSLIHSAFSLEIPAPSNL